MNFKSQICTSREQSELLLSLGLKKETADMCSVIDFVSDNGKTIEEVDTIFAFTPNDWEDFGRHVTPRWSLHRLIKDLMPDTIAVENATCMGHRFFYLLTFMHDDVTYEVNSFVFKEFAEHDNYYDNIIDCIEWLIKEGYFNKEYLEE